MGKDYKPDFERLHYRGLIEEFHANIYVEDSQDIPNQKEKAVVVWLNFNPKESNPAGVVAQILQIAEDFKLSALFFAVGDSKEMCYVSRLGGFFYIRPTQGGGIPTPDELERVLIPTIRVVASVKNLFLENKRRKLLNDDYKHNLSQPKTKRPKK